MSLQPALQGISVEEYLAGEQRTENRHEYINGAVHAMGGASAAHNLIAGNLFILLHAAARGTPCQVFMADMKAYLRIADEDIFYYPDLLVSCDPDDRAPYFRSRPCLIAEVLSPATERIDRREKFLACTSLPSLQEYLLLAQEQQAALLFRRRNGWKPEWFGSGDTFSSDCLDCALSVAQIYEATGIESSSALSGC